MQQILLQFTVTISIPMYMIFHPQFKRRFNKYLIIKRFKPVFSPKKIHFQILHVKNHLFTSQNNYNSAYEYLISTFQFFIVLGRGKRFKVPQHFWLPQVINQRLGFSSIDLNILSTFTSIDLSLNILWLRAFSNALEYWREDIFQSMPVFIIALNSS